MKKNTRILSMAAAALLAVAPVATGVIPSASGVTVKAANNSVELTAPTTSTVKNATFYYGGNPLANGASVPTSINIKNGDTVSSIVKAINDSGVQIQYVDANNRLVSSNISVDAQYVTTVLENAVKGVTFTDTTDKKDQTVSGLSGNFSLPLSYPANGSNIIVHLPVGVNGASATQDANAPVFKVEENGKSTNSRSFNIASGSTFNPLNFTTSEGNKISISAQQSSGSTNNAAVTVTSNPVDTTNAGRFYTVTLSASNTLNKTATLSYQINVVPSGETSLPADTPTYGIYAGSVIATGNTLKAGTKVYVGSTTQNVNNVSYTKVSTVSKADADSSSNNVWVKTSDLTKAAEPSKDTNTTTKTVMVDSRAYDKNGNYLGHMYYAYNDIEIVPTVVTINGKTYYKVANKDEYVRVTNITGNQRTLRHNAYIYWSSYRRTPGTGKMYRGQTVTTYGGQMRFKNGKKYYRIDGCRNNNKRYIKAVNFY